jgi:hypothetical protein
MVFGPSGGVQGPLRPAALDAQEALVLPTLALGK